MFGQGDRWPAQIPVARLDKTSRRPADEDALQTRHILDQLTPPQATDRLVAVPSLDPDHVVLGEFVIQRRSPPPEWNME
jgi:hypothetical protein